MTLRKQVKYNGRRCLYNNWGKAIAIVLLSVAIYLLFTMVESMISMLLGVPFFVDYGDPGYYLDNLPNLSWVSMTLTLIMAIGSFLVVTPLNLGITQWYYSLSDGESEDILSIFGCFSNRKIFFRSLVLRLNILVREALWALLYFLIPGAILCVSSWYSYNGPEQWAYLLGTVGTIFGVMLGLLFSVFYGITIQKYFLAKYYLISGEVGVLGALKQARRASKGKRESIFLFKLSYIGWFASCVLVIPVLYVFPYYEVSSLLYARVLMEQHARSTQLVPVEPQTPSQEDFATQTFEAQKGQPQE